MTDITWNGASGDWTEADDWTPAQVPASGDNATIAGTGTISVILGGGETAAVSGILLDNTNATLEIDGLLNAETISLDAGTLANDGTIADATLVLDGGTLSSGYGLYQGDTIVGPMEIGGSDTAVVQQGLTVLAADGTSPGTVTVDGDYATLEFNDSETFDNATVVLGSAAGIDMLDTEGTLTLG
ncbi:MAG TPA: hypothetical protein VL752_03210, partial [Acidisoma sp.]|nr:hypothetical protein [Acidisoma sp.]